MESEVEVRTQKGSPGIHIQSQNNPIPPIHSHSFKIHPETGKHRRLHNEEFDSLDRSPSIVRVVELKY